METERFLQPLWDFILSKFGKVVSYWLFPWFLGSSVYIGVALYFTVKDIGPWRDEKTRIHVETFPTVRKVFDVGALQVVSYGAVNTVLWFGLPYFNVLPEKAPTMMEVLRDLVVTVLTSDFLIYCNHLMHHKIIFLYRNVHFIHHQFTNDMFAWCASWVHPFEIGLTVVFMVLYPWILFPVHPLTLWIYACVIVPFLVEEHSGHDVWWSPYNWVPSVCGGAVPHEVHHVKIKYNYGFVFAIWDRIFGTYLAPKDA